MESPCRKCDKHKETFPVCIETCNSLTKFRHSTLRSTSTLRKDPTESYRFSGMTKAQKDFYSQSHISNN
ncbi:MAG: hypothetical protein KAS32_14235 [Candidatus Peribacteraceae bacterium]|nr:hypothetical protein [Candidatus Peribacteraceae bacterium]